MKKNTINAFTLVEMLIVIVIIGILIAALLPRMQAAQWRARDVSRKTALSQIQSAIVVSQWDKWAWPGMEGNETTATNLALNWLDVKDIEKQLEPAWLNWIPKDPLNSVVLGLWTRGDDAEDGQYRYMVLPRNGTPAWWFILMAKTEVEWWSNWIYCDNAGDDETKWAIKPQTSATSVDWATDLKDIIPCETIEERKSDAGGCGIEDDNKCYYENDWELRYIITY